MSSENCKFELLQAKDYSQYLLSNRREILQVLNSLMQKRALMMAYLEGDGMSFLTALLAVDEGSGTLLLDSPSDEAMQARAIAATRLMCVTQLDRVKIQFATEEMVPVAANDGGGLRARLPDTLLRLQRREYYRLVAPVTHALTCAIPIAADGRTTTCETRVVDISAGGVAVMVPPQGVAFEPGMEFPDCRLSLPEIGPIVTTLSVRNLFRITNRNGVTMIRAGCQFLGLPGNAHALIQRYIFKIERERNARERGL